MKRILLTLQFDGSGYCGWQVQPNGVSVQSRLQDAIQRITGFRSGVIGCSRTDAGVHAESFCCTFDTECPLTDDRLCAALNAVLPKDIAVQNARRVPLDFHPRYMATGKKYVYRIWNARQRNPFWENRAWHLSRPLDENLLNTAAQDFLGSHDFLSFCSAGSRVLDTVRRVTAASVTRENDLITFSVEANGFLYHMVRIMTGTLTEMAAGHISYRAIPDILFSRNRSQAGLTAPAHGLYLQKVYYAGFA